MYQAANDRYEKMAYVRCGKSGLKLPAISLGLWHNFGDTGVYENMKEILFTAFDNGIVHFDLANNYGPAYGSAEKNQHLCGWRINIADQLADLIPWQAIDLAVFQKAEALELDNRFTMGGQKANGLLIDLIDIGGTHGDPCALHGINCMNDRRGCCGSLGLRSGNRFDFPDNFLVIIRSAYKAAARASQHDHITAALIQKYRRIFDLTGEFHGIFRSYSS